MKCCYRMVARHIWRMSSRTSPCPPGPRQDPIFNTILCITTYCFTFQITLYAWQVCWLNCLSQTQEGDLENLHCCEKPYFVLATSSCLFLLCRITRCRIIVEINAPSCQNNPYMYQRRDEEYSKCAYGDIKVMPDTLFEFGSLARWNQEGHYDWMAAEPI